MERKSCEVKKKRGINAKLIIVTIDNEVKGVS